jgi:hypothetical protein
MPYCIACGSFLTGSDGFFVCRTDTPVPVQVVDKHFCNTCGKVRKDDERKFTQCPSCYQRWIYSELREVELRTSLKLGIDR